MTRKNMRNVAIIMATVGIFGLGSTLGASTTAKYSKSVHRTTQGLTLGELKSNDTIQHYIDVISLSGEKLLPGSRAQLFSFDVNKEDTQVSVEYLLTLETIGPLFDGDTPVELIVYRTVNGVAKEEVDMIYENGIYKATGLKPLSKNDTITVDWNWEFESGKNDNDYAGKSGKVKVVLDAVQVQN